MATKYVYSFSPSGSDGNGSQKPLLGGKGANLAEMCNIGLPVPAGFTMSTEVCTEYYKNDRNYPPELDQPGQRRRGQTGERTWARKFGDHRPTRCSFPFAREHANPCPA